MSLVITPAIRAKLHHKHHVDEEEILQAFANREHGFLIDTREVHRTEPPTEWFIAETDKGRKLKICFVYREGDIHIKSAYSPSQVVIDLYERHAR